MVCFFFAAGFVDAAPGATFFAGGALPAGFDVEPLLFRAAGFFATLLAAFALRPRMTFLMRLVSLAIFLSTSRRSRRLIKGSPRRDPLALGAASPD